MARKLPWFKRYPSNSITGMLGLDLEEKGLYNLFIDLCYDRSGPIEEDQGEVARMAGCGPRMYRRVRDALLSKGKLIRLEDGRLIVRGFRMGDEGHADAQRPEMAAEPRGNGAETAPQSRRKRPETAPENTSDRGKSNTYDETYARTRAGAPVQTPESRVQNDSNLVMKFCSELGIEHDPRGNQRNWQSILERLIEDSGLDFNLDILAAVKYLRDMGTLPEQVRTPGFFRHEAIRFRDLRLSGKPVATVHTIGPKAEDMTRGDWAHRLRRFLECGIWIGPGADPTCLTCIAPPDLLAGCRAKWRDQGDHPVWADTDCNFAWRAEGGRGLRGIIWPQPKPVDAEQAKEA